jgi:ornithine carbamoyltransferase
MRKLAVVSRAPKELTPPLPPATLARKHLISLHDLTTPDIDYLINLGRRLKSAPTDYKRRLEGKTLAMICEKPSLPSRVTFDLGISQLGGRALYLGSEEVELSKPEGVKDVARNLSLWVEVIMVRVRSHQTAMGLAESATVPVINALSDFEHPCQALSDYMTLVECKGKLADITLAWVGDGNNTAHSLIYGAARLGVRMRIATPPGYEPDRSVVADAKLEGGNVMLTHDPAEAVAGADVVYTDIWPDIGNEEETEARQEVFRSYQVNSQLMRAAAPQALFMHCQPTRRNEEVTGDVIDSPRSLVYPQAENCLHMQKAILLALLS